MRRCKIEKIDTSRAFSTTVRLYKYARHRHDAHGREGVPAARNAGCSVRPWPIQAGISRIIVTVGTLMTHCGRVLRKSRYPRICPLFRHELWLRQNRYNTDSRQSKPTVTWGRKAMGQQRSFPASALMVARLPKEHTDELVHSLSVAFGPRQKDAAAPPSLHRTTRGRKPWKNGSSHRRAPAMQPTRPGGRRRSRSMTSPFTRRSRPSRA